MDRRILVTESSMAASVMVPAAMTGLISSAFMTHAQAISISRPFIIEVECLAYQSDITYPLKTRVSFKSCFKVTGFSQLQSPMILF